MTDATADTKLETLWRDRETKILAGITTIAEEDFRVSVIYKYWHLGCSVLVMVCAVLAPLFIVSSKNSEMFFLNSNILSNISLFITVVLGITEGLRRIFRFEQRWYSYYSASNSLIQTRERYVDATLELAPGSEEWKERVFALRKDVQGIFNEQNELFFQGVLEQSELSGSNDKSKRKR